MTTPAKGAKWYTIKATGSTLDIAIHDEIGFYGITGDDFIKSLNSHKGVTEINLSIHSSGGSVFEGLAILNALREHPATVNVYVAGLAASMASAIAMAGDTITIPENAFMMVHLPRGGASGTAEEMRSHADLLDQVTETLTNIYVKRTGLSREEVGALLSAETWLSGPECVEKGFADKLAEPAKMVANARPGAFDVFNALPDGAKQLIGAPVSAEGQQLQALLADKRRREEIDGQVSDWPELENIAALQASGELYKLSPDEVRKMILSEITNDATTVSAAPRHAIHAGNGAIVRDSIRNALAARVGVDKLEDGNRYGGMQLVELARASLVDNGVGTWSMDRINLVSNAFTHGSGDFSVALSDVAHKSMLKGYAEADETFEKWTTEGTLTDFREVQRVDLSRFPSLRKVNEGAEFKFVTTSDRGETIMLATYGELFSITRQAIINDDLDVFSRIPRMFGRAARRTIGDAVYAALTGSPTMGDGKGLWHSDHSNTSTPAALDIEGLSAIEIAMATQKEGGASLGIQPAYLLAPAELAGTAKAMIGARFDPSYGESQVPNKAFDMAEVIKEARLDDADPNTFYVVANAMQYDTIEVAYLDGNKTPFLDQQGGFEVDGITHKVRIDAGVAPLSWRAMHRATITP